MKTLILCGDNSGDLHPPRVDAPTPLVPVAGHPILRHVMEIYASQGFVEFVLAAGFKHELVEAYAAELPADWDVTVVNTGKATNTGARIAYCRRALGETFFVTYGDGVGNIDLLGLLDAHRRHPGSATVTTVPLPSQYGTMQFAADGRVEQFSETPLLLDHWINAGFFVFDQRAFERWSGDDLERQVLPALGAAGQLYAYQHRGFWTSMRTYRDALDFSALCFPADNPAALVAEGLGVGFAQAGGHR